MNFLECDNLKSFKGFYSLVMVRGRRRILVGLFPHQDRAAKVASDLDWSSDFRPEISPVNLADLSPANSPGLKVKLKKKYRIFL